jgi:hypothetical protein
MERRKRSHLRGRRWEGFSEVTTRWASSTLGPLGAPLVPSPHPAISRLRRSERFLCNRSLRFAEPSACALDEGGHLSLPEQPNEGRDNRYHRQYKNGLQDAHNQVFVVVHPIRRALSHFEFPSFSACEDQPIFQGETGWSSRTLTTPIRAEGARPLIASHGVEIADKATVNSAAGGQRITGDGHAPDGQSGDEEHNLMQSERLLHNDCLSVQRFHTLQSRNE